MSDHACNFYCTGETHSELLSCAGADWTAARLQRWVEDTQPWFDVVSIVAAPEHPMQIPGEAYLSPDGTVSPTRDAPATSWWRMTFLWRGEREGDGPT